MKNINKEQVQKELLKLENELEKFFIFSDDLGQIGIETVLGNELFQRIKDAVFEFEKKYDLK